MGGGARPGRTVGAATDHGRARPRRIACSVTSSSPPPASPISTGRSRATSTRPRCPRSSGRSRSGSGWSGGRLRPALDSQDYPFQPPLEPLKPPRGSPPPPEPFAASRGRWELGPPGGLSPESPGNPHPSGPSSDPRRVLGLGRRRVAPSDVERVGVGAGLVPVRSRSRLARTNRTGGT